MEQAPRENLGQDNAYVGRRSDLWLAHMSERRADESAAFLLPYLRPGMRVLDCGCGPGSITIGLARIVEPGHVTGVDVSEQHIRLANERAADERAPNVQFEVGNVYHLTFPNQSFDAVLARAVLEHLTEPVKALREMHRVLKPGGVIGVADADWDGMLLAPESPLLLDSAKLFMAFADHEGGNQRIGKQLRRLLRQTGFIKVEVAARYTSHGTVEAVQVWGNRFAGMLREERVVADIVRLGLADRPTLDAMAEAWLVWSKDPDAFLAQPGCTAIGWVA
jgi:ubiquinone/menaquinone biosynthesis C-methylase UbiE